MKVRIKKAYDKCYRKEILEIRTVKDFQLFTSHLEITDRIKICCSPFELDILYSRCPGIAYSIDDIFPYDKESLL